MWTRRELMTGSVAGSLASAVQDRQAAELQMDREAARTVASEIHGVKDVLTTIADGSALPGAVVTRLRDQMATFLRANGKFPDFFDVGHAVFYDVYDWHVKNAHPLIVGRQPDGRYALQFMFTRLILRREQDADHVSAPYDGR